VEADDLLRGRARVGERLLPGFAVRRVEVEWLVGYRDDARFDRHERLMRRQCTRIRVLLIKCGEGAERGAGFSNRAREDADAVERPARRKQAGGRDETPGRLEPDDAVEGGGYAAGSRGVGAERQRHQAQRDGDRAAAAAPARDVRWMTDRVAGAVRAAGPDEPGGELVEVGLADRDRSRVDESLHGGRVARSGRRAGQRREGGARRLSG